MERAARAQCRRTADDEAILKTKMLLAIAGVEREIACRYG
jgi:hypothetical protein